MSYEGHFNTKCSHFEFHYAKFYKVLDFLESIIYNGLERLPIEIIILGQD